MASAIDATKPVGPIAYTADVRANFATAASEISLLQSIATGGPFLPISGGTSTGMTHFSAGFSFQGGDGSPGSFYTDANWGGTIRGRSGALADLMLQTAAGPPALRVKSDGGVTIDQYLTTENTGRALTGSQGLLPVVNVGIPLSGTSGFVGNMYTTNLGSADSLQAPAASKFELGVITNLEAGWQGSRGSVWGYISTMGNTDLTPSAAAGGGAIVSGNFAVSSNHNVGGVAAGYGTTQFGLGSQWGQVTQTIVQGGSTYWNSSVGIEIDNTVLSGANVLWNIGLLLTSYFNHQVHGSLIDSALVINSDSTTKWRNGIMIGGPQSHTIDPNGYFIRGLGGPYGPAAMSAAGGVDMLQPNFTGTGTGGGGFAFRSANYQVLNSGFVQIGPGMLSFDTNNMMIIDAVFQKVTAAAVATGGANFSTNDVMEGADGSFVTVTSVGAGGAVTGVSILKSGWAHAGFIPANPVTFTSQGRTGAGAGSGCTLNLTWTTSAADLALQLSGGGITTFGPPAQHVSILQGAGYNFIQSSSGGLILDSVNSLIAIGWSGTTLIDMNAPTAFAAGSNVGFYGTNPIAKPTVSGAKGSNAALASLLGALAAYGLITDSTTA